jgi:hypothetical protein
MRTWWTIDVHLKDVLLDLQKEEVLGNFLDELLAHVFRIKFCKILKKLYIVNDVAKSLM